MNNKLIILGLFVLVLLATSVNATLDIVGTPTVTFGDTTVKVSNPNSDRESEKVINLTSATITLKNSGAGVITGIGLDSVSAGTGFSSDITANTVAIDTISKTSLNPLETTTITLKAKAPKNLAAVDSSFVEKAFKIGSVIFNATDSGAKIISSSVEMDMQRKNQLTIKNVKWKVKGKTQTADREGDDVKNVKPGDHVRVEFEVENQYSSSDNVDIQDVEFDVKSLDSKLDIDESEDLGDISSDDKNTGSFDFDLDDDTDSGTSEVEMTLSGVDEFGAKHGERVKIRFKVERENHEIAIKSIVLSPEKVDCTAGNAKLVVSYANIGKSDEDQITIEVDAPKLDYNQKVTDVQVDKDNGDTNAFNIQIPANLETGTYPIEVRTYYDQNKLTDSQVAVLNSVCEKGKVTTSGKTASASLSLATSKVSLSQGGNANLGVTVVNAGTESATFGVSVDADWSESVASKTVTLNPGASTSVIFNLVARSNAPAGQDSGVVEVYSGSTLLSSQSFTADVSKTEKTTNGKTTTTGDFFKDNSTAIWVIVDIILIVIALVLIKVLFFRKSQPRAF